MKQVVGRLGPDNDRPGHGHGVQEIGTEDDKILLGAQQVASFSVVSDSGEVCLCCRKAVVTWIFSVSQSPAEGVGVIGPSQVAHRDEERQIWAEGFFWEGGSVLAVVTGCEGVGCEGDSCYDLPVFSKCFPVPWTYLAGVYTDHPFRLGDLPCDLPHDRPNGPAYDLAGDPADGLPDDHRYGRPCGHECGLLDGLQDGLPTGHQPDQPSDRLHDLRYDRPNGLPHDRLHDPQCGQPNGLPHGLLHVLLYDPPIGHHYASGGVGID